MKYNDEMIKKGVLLLSYDVEPVHKKLDVRVVNGFAMKYTTTKVKKFYKDIQELTQPQLPENFKLFDCDLRASVVFTRPRLKSDPLRYYAHTVPDLDNYLKALWDALKGVVFTDDCRIVDVHASKVHGTPGIHLGIGELREGDTWHL